MHFCVHGYGQRIRPSHSGFLLGNRRGKRTPLAGKKCCGHTLGKCIWKYFKREKNSIYQDVGTTSGRLQTNSKNKDYNTASEVLGQ